MRTMIAIAASGMLLTGCAGRYVPLWVVPQPDASQSAQQRLTDTLKRLHDFGERFASTYTRASKEADLAQVPLIGAAIALGFIAVNKPSNAADTVAKIGIGVGAYAAGRSLAAPSGGPEIFRKGVDAINCVLVEGPAFVGSDVEATVHDLSGRTVDLDTDTALLAAAVGNDVVVTKDSEKKAVELARANARLALARAAAASQAARAQLGAYESAPAEFERTAGTIISTLASKSSVHTVIDVSALAASWTKAPQTDASLHATDTGGDTATSYVTMMNASVAQLDREAAGVAALTSGVHFADRLTAVAKCPALI